MSTTTSDLQLFKYDTSTDGKEVFSISSALNANWDKIDSFASAIKSLSNLSTEGEKRFTDLENSIANKLEADVLLAENGYIKFNNGLILQWGKWAAATATGWIAFPIVFPTAKPMLASNIEANANTYAVANMFPYDVTTSGFQRTVSSPDRRCTYIAIGR